MSKYVGFRLGKVHEKRVISNYYCGGCGWPVTDHDSFCPECGGAFRECDASNLETENAKFGTGFSAGAAVALILLAIILKLKGWI